MYGRAPQAAEDKASLPLETNHRETISMVTLRVYSSLGIRYKHIEELEDVSLSGDSRQNSPRERLGGSTLIWRHLDDSCNLGVSSEGLYRRRNSMTLADSRRWRKKVQCVPLILYLDGR